METIFDHNPTAEEIELFTFSKEQYIANRDKDSLIADIATLYYYRDNIKKSNEYWTKIPDKFELWKLDRGRDWKPTSVDVT